jgi:predicted Rossmann-fold nucleotide-binding protein
MSPPRRSRRRTLEVESRDELDALVAGGATSMDGWQLQGLDLRGRSAVLRGLDPRGALLLGCVLEPGVEEELQARGALVFPALPDVPVAPYRARLYTPDELYDGLRSADDGGSYGATLDARVYAWAQQTGHDLHAVLARALHDLAIDDALDELVAGRHLVGVMGGHALARDSTGYADAARLGRSLSVAGLTVATGGGPGAMEAANLGAYLAGHDEHAVAEALDVLGSVPGYEPSVGDWAQSAIDVRGRFPDGTDSLGVPTWFYGHEPPNAFANQIAKYFKNAIREDTLLHVCTAGIVFLPGRGGTVQEVFQDACENYYATGDRVAPMVLVGTEYWTEELPVWPLLQRLAEGREMADALHLVDDLDEVAARLDGPARLDG